MRVLNPNWKWWPAWLDVYPNAQLLPKIKAPILIIHVRSQHDFYDCRRCFWLQRYHQKIFMELAFANHRLHRAMCGPAT